MDIKDSYLHGTTGVVKAISVDADNNIKYTLADVAGTIKTVNQNLVTTTNAGQVPKADAAAGTIDSTSSDWVLTNNNGSIGWYKLPATAFYYRPVQVNGTAILGSNNTALNLIPGSNINITNSGGNVTISSPNNTTISQAIPYITGSSTDTAGAWTGSHAGIIEYTEGLTIMYVPAVAGTTPTTTLNINGLGAKTCYTNNATKLTTHYSVGTPILFTYVGGNWKRADYDSTMYTSAYSSTSAATETKTATCSGYVLKNQSYIHITMRYSNTAQKALTLNIANTGAKPIYINGVASSASNYTLPAGTYIIYYDGTNFYFRTDGILPGKIEKATLTDTITCQQGGSDVYRPIVVTPGDNSVYYNNLITANYSTGDLKATSFTGTFKGTADKVSNNLVVKIKSGTTEGTDLYTYNGSASKTLDIKQGSGITLTAAANSLTITNAGVRSIATGTANGTISVNTNGTSANVAVKGLGTAAYMSSASLMSYSNIADYVAARLSADLSSKAHETYIEYWGSPGWYNSKWGWIEAVDGFKGNLTGNVAGNVTGNSDTATKLKTARTLWGQSFDGSANVSGDMTGVGNITINATGNVDYFINFLYNSTPNYSWRLGYLGSGSGDANYFVLQSSKASGGNWYNAVQFGNETLNALFAGTVTAPSFVGPLTGNADTATKLATARTIWGQSFDGSANISGDMTGVGIINTILNLTTKSGDASVYLETSTATVDYAHIYVTNKSNKTHVTRPLVLQNGFGNVGIGVEQPTQKLEVNGNVKATAFLGNLDGSYVNALTGYSKATAKAAIAVTDTLNTALGKLEFKADAAYDLVKGAYDGDGTIENLAEILKVLEGIKDTDTIQAIVGKYLPLTGGTITGEIEDPLRIKTSSNRYSAIQFRTVDNHFIRFGFAYVESNTVPRLFITGHDAWSTEYSVLHTGNSYIKNGVITINGTSITPLTAHQSLANYVTLDTAQTITGAKTFDANVKMKAGVDLYGSVDYSGLQDASYKFGLAKGLIHLRIDNSNNYWGNAITWAYNSSSNAQAGIYVTTGGGYGSEMWLATTDSFTEGPKASLKIDARGNIYGIRGPFKGTFVSTGGTSAQFVKGDGSLDSNVYLTSSSLSNYVTLDGAQTISGVKTFSSQQKFTVAQGTAPFTVTSTTKVINLNADLLDGASSSDFIREYLYSSTTASADDFFTKLKTIKPTGTIGVRSSHWGSIISNKSLGWGYGLIYAQNSYKESDSYGVNMGGIYIPQSGNDLYVLGSSGGSLSQAVDITAYKVLTENNYTSYLGYIGTTSVRSSSAEQELTGITNIKMNGDIVINAANTDKFLNFFYTASGASYSFRLGYLGTGSWDTNYLVIQGTTSGTDWTNALRIGCLTLDAAFGGNIYPLVTNTKTLGTSSLRWSNLYSVLGNFSGNVVLTDGTDTTPKLTFQRNTATDDSYDYSIFANSSAKLEISLYSSSTGTKTVATIDSSGNYSGNAATATALAATTVVSSKAINLVNTSWADTGYTFTNLATGTYTVQVTSGSNLVASGMMSIYKNLSDTVGDEIPLHVYGTAGWRPYLRTYSNKLQISSNDASSTSRTVTIKIAKLL